MRILDLALKDMSQLVRDWKSFAFLLVMPVAFTLLFGFIFSGAGGEASDPRLPVGVLDQDDGGTLSAHLLALLNASDAIRPIVLEDADIAEAEKQVGDEELAAALIIPTGYSQQALSLSDGAWPRPVVIVDPDSNAGHTAQNGIQAVLARLLGSVEAARLAARAYEAQGGTADSAFVQETLVRAVDAWAQPPLTITTSQSGATGAEEEDPAVEANGFAHSSAGIMIQFAMAGLIGAATILVLERKSGSLRRLLTTPIKRIEIVLGHFVAMYLMILLQLVVLVLFGQLVLGVGYFRVPLGATLMILITTFWAASLGLLIGIFSRTEEQVIIFSLVIMLLLSGLGGAWMPLEFTSPTFQTVGHLLPAAWAIDGFENIVVRGLGFDSVLLPAGVLLAYAALFSAIAVWRFRFE